MCSGHFQSFAEDPSDTIAVRAWPPRAERPVLVVGSPLPKLADMLSQINS